MSGADLQKLSTDGDARRADAMEAAADTQHTVGAILSAHGGGLERTPAGFQLHVPLAEAGEAQP